MVGALADWFAVTALFRHPLGLPIPHTALIPTNKDQLGDRLGEFVGTHFLTEEVVRAKVAEAEVTRRVGHWLGDRPTPIGSPASSAGLCEGCWRCSTRSRCAPHRERDHRAGRAHGGLARAGPPPGRGSRRPRALRIIDVLAERTHNWVAVNRQTICRRLPSRPRPGRPGSSTHRDRPGPFDWCDSWPPYAMTRTIPSVRRSTGCSPRSPRTSGRTRTPARGGGAKIEVIATRTSSPRCRGSGRRRSGSPRGSRRSHQRASDSTRPAPWRSWRTRWPRPRDAGAPRCWVTAPL